MSDNEYPGKVGKEEGDKLIKAGGCPANNTLCEHLALGMCRCASPDLYKREDVGYLCGSYKT